MNTKLLRQKILDLAIRGKLTEQKKSDGTTKDLLKQIQDERTGEALQTRDSSTCHCEAQKRRGNLKQSKSATPKEIIPLDKSEAPFEIPENWEWVRLGDVSYIASGSTPSKDCFVDDGVPYLKMYNLRNQQIDFQYKPQFIKREIHEGKLARSRAKPYDVIMNIVGPPLGKIALIPETLPECNFNQAAVLIRAHYETKLMSQYIRFYLMQMDEINSINTKGTAGQENLSLSQTQNMRLPLPPLAEQQRIVTAIENAFAEITEIENNQELLKKHIKQGRQKILDLAIRGKLTEQKKSDGTTKDLLKQISSNVILSNAKNPAETVKSSRVILSKRSASKDLAKEIIPLNKDEPPFEIPETWEWVKLGDICTVGSAKRVLQEDWKDSGIPFYRAREIAQLANGEKVKDDLFITQELYESLKSLYGVPQPGDILMSAVGTIGKTYIVAESDCFYYKDASVICLKKKILQVSSEYLKIVLASDFLQKQMYANSSGTTVDTITISVAQEYLIPLPPLAEQQRIVAAIESAFTEFDAMEKSL